MVAEIISVGAVMAAAMELFGNTIFIIATKLGITEEKVRQLLSDPDTKLSSLGFDAFYFYLLTVLLTLDHNLVMPLPGCNGQTFKVLAEELNSCISMKPQCGFQTTGKVSGQI